MKSILIYGDSLVFGKIPGGLRFEKNKRFTGVCQRELGEDYEVIEEGLRGRTLSGENTFFPHRDGLEQFGPILGSHLPIDLLILFLGTNDANSGSAKKSEDFEKDLLKYKEQIEFWCNHLAFEPPKVLLIAPPHIEEENSYSLFKEIFRGSKEKSQKFSFTYQNIAGQLNWDFLDSSKLVRPSVIDGVHLDEANNKILGKEIAKKIKEIL